MFQKLYNGIMIAAVAAKRFYLENYTDRASSLSFTTLLAIVPLISVLVSLVSFFPVFNKLILLTQHYIFSNFIPTSGSTIETYIESFVDKASHLPIIGFLFLFLTSALLVITIESSLNDIWKVSHRRTSFWSWVFYWLILFMAPFCIGISLFVSTYIFSTVWITHSSSLFSLQTMLLSLFPLFLNATLFSLLYTVVPNCHVRWCDGFVGGFVAAVLFEIAKKCFAVYVLNFSSYELIYGVLATLPIFLVWIYVSWVIVLYGALIVNIRSLSTSPCNT